MSNWNIYFFSSNTFEMKQSRNLVIFVLILEYHTPGNMDIRQEYLFSAKYSNASIVRDGQFWKFRLGCSLLGCSQQNNTVQYITIGLFSCDVWRVQLISIGLDLGMDMGVGKGNGHGMAGRPGNQEQYGLIKIYQLGCEPDRHHWGCWARKRRHL